IDLNPVAWARAAVPDPHTGDQLSLENALDNVLVYCNAHLALRHENELAVFAAGPDISRQLYSSQLATAAAAAASSASPSTSTSTLADASTYQQFRQVDERIRTGVKELMNTLPDEPDGTSNLVGALSMALCRVAAAQSSPMKKAKPRIVILSVTQDASTQYVPIMNCIFTAQKNNIQIDVCKIHGTDAVFLQQACHLTGGAYFRLQRRAGLLQYLMMGFLPGPTARRNLNQPKQEHVDLRAACFCHRKIVDIGYVCSVCLSIFCSPLPVCSTCRTKFPMSTLKRLGFG
ncbi:transcription factor Tfb4, partial [Rhodotorula sp. JG-1b]